MATEIERKFLLNHTPREQMINGIRMVQGYMMNQKKKVIRIRLAGDQGFLTVKGETVNGTRKEYEYPIPATDAREMLQQFCQSELVEKTRYKIEYNRFHWEVDEFHGTNFGLIVAEIELNHIDQPFEKPDWVGKEVTNDPKYYNSNLIKSPYSTWK